VVTNRSQSNLSFLKEDIAKIRVNQRELQIKNDNFFSYNNFTEQQLNRVTFVYKQRIFLQTVFNYLKLKLMATEKEHRTSTRTLLVLKAIIQNSKKYTKQQLADMYGVSKDAIDDDFRAIRNAGFELKYDENYRYHIELDKSYEYLKSLLVFSSKEENLIIEGLQNIKHDEKTTERLMRKISRIYDVSKMHNTFDKGFLTRTF
jgi:biotin operon repressor